MDLRALGCLGRALGHVRCPGAGVGPHRRARVAPRAPPGQVGRRLHRPRRVRAPAGAPTHLLVVEGGNAGQRAELENAPLLIGRGSDAAIRLDDDYVSTRHARVAAAGEEWFVEDLGSTNGTYIGTVRITTPTTLTPGTQVRIGKTILELRK